MTDKTATDRARKALKGITPGPWEANVDGAGDYFITRPDGQAIVDINGGDDASEPDAKFVAAARSLVPDLLVENERLRAEVRAARAQGMRDAADLVRGVLHACEQETSRHDYLSYDHDMWSDRWKGAHEAFKAINAAADALEKGQADD